MQQFALGWLVVQLAVGEGHPERASFYLGLTGLARLIPALATGLVGGVAADRFDRARLLALTRTACAVAVGLLALLVLTEQVTLPLALLLTAAFGVALAFDGPARLALVQTLVEPHVAFQALGLVRVSRQMSQIVGPLLGGLLIIPLGVGGVMAANTVLYGLSGVGLGRLPSRPALAEGTQAESPMRAFREGIAYVRGDPTLLGFMMVTVLLTAFANCFAQLLPAVAHESLGVGALELSWLASAAGVGAVTGAVIVMRMGGWARPERVLFGAVTLLAVLLVGFGLQRSLPLSVALSGLIGCALTTYFGGSGNVIQLVTPAPLRGRVLGLQLTLGNAGTQLGILVLGSLGSLIGISNALSLAGLVIAATAVWMMRMPGMHDAGRRLHELNAERG